MGGDAGGLGPSWKSLDGSQVPSLQLPKLVLLAGPRPLPYVGHVGRDVETGTGSDSSSVRGMGTLALVLRPGGEDRGCCSVGFLAIKTGPSVQRTQCIFTY